MEGMGHDGVETEIQPAVSGRACAGVARGWDGVACKRSFDDLLSACRTKSHVAVISASASQHVLAQDFPQVFNQLPFVLKGQPFAVMVPIVIKLLLDDGHARAVLEQGPDQIESSIPGAEPIVSSRPPT